MNEKKLHNLIKSQKEEKIHKVFNEIYVNYGKLVFFVISKYIEKYEDIEDLTNDVFLDFFNHIETITFNNLKAYLTVSAKNKALNFLKKQNNTIITDDVYIITDEQQDNRAYYLLLKKMEECLSKEEIDIVIWHAVEGKKFKEIATLLLKPTNTIITRYHRAINKFKKSKRGR